MGVVHVIAGTLRQPFLHFRVLVGAVVVEHEVDLLTGIDRLVDPIEKPEELLMAMAGLALANNGPFEDVQRGE